jgi:hypothetical protein
MIKMETKKFPIIILAIVAIIAILSLVFFFRVQKEAAVTYQQLLHRDYAVVADYSICDNGPCGKSAIYLGDDLLEGNAVCQCPDGSTYQTDYRRTY